MRVWNVDLKGIYSRSKELGFGQAFLTLGYCIYPDSAKLT